MSSSTGSEDERGAPPPAASAPPSPSSPPPPPRRNSRNSGLAFERSDALVEAPALAAAVFESWDAFFAYLSQYQAATYQHFRLRTTTSAEERNRRIRSSSASTARLIPPEWGAYSKTLVCTHAGTYQYRGTGKRKWHETRPLDCKARMNVVVQWRDGHFVVVVTKAVLGHNHALSQVAYKQYAVVRPAVGGDVVVVKKKASAPQVALESPAPQSAASASVSAPPASAASVGASADAASSQVRTPRTLERYVVNYEREWEPILSLWVQDALVFSHERVLATVDPHSLSSSQADATDLPLVPPVFVDVGCGTGALALAFAMKYDFVSPESVSPESRLRDVRVIATDIADGMLARVDDKLDTLPRFQQYRSQIKTVQMDGQLLDKLDDASADIIGSNFGLSIFPDRVKAWSSAARVLRDGGVLFATVWDAQSAHMRWIDGCANLVRTAKGNARWSGRGSSQPADVPSAGMNIEAIVRELEASGFCDVEAFRTRHSIVYSTPRALVDAMLSSFEFARFLEHSPRERLADYLYGVLVKEGGFALNLAAAEQHAESRPTYEDVKWSSRPVTVEFVANVVVASRQSRGGANRE